LETVANYSTAGLLVGEWSFTSQIIINNLIFDTEKEKLTILIFFKSICS